MKKQLLILGLILASSFLFSQEICNNGIDDDGDGLIDLNDTVDCNCTQQVNILSIPSLIPNPSFEAHSCCPTTYGQGLAYDGLGCADDWEQVGGATSDYFNTCDWNGASNSLPFPHGEAAAGMFSFDGWCEYVGGLYTEALQSDTIYQMNFFLSFDNMTSDVTSCGSPTDTADIIDFTMYGTPNTSDIPFTGYTCPIGQGSWVELGHVAIDPMTIFETWQEVSITFEPDTNIAAFALGPPCDLPTNGYSGYTSSCAPYFLIDSLILNKAVYFNNHLIVDSIGTYNSNLTLNAHTDTIGTFQWYLNGIAIAGETDSIIDITGNAYPAGNYQVVFNYGIDCIVGEILVDNPLSINEEIKNNNITVFPNPATNNLQIIIPRKRSGVQFNKNNVFVYDIYGRIIKQYKLLSYEGESGFRLDISKLKKGVYFIKIDGLVAKFIKN